MSKNILIYSNTGLSSKQIGLSYEVLKDLKKTDDKLHVVLCNNKLKNCFFNRSHNYLGCVSCQSRALKVLSLANYKENELYHFESSFDFTNFKIPFFNNLEELTNYTFDGIEIGRGVSSSIVSYYRDYDINSNNYKEIIELEIKKAIDVTVYFKKFIAKNKIDEFYIFNGRFAEIHPLIELAKLYKKDFYTIESGSKTNYELFKNSLPHSIEYTSLSIANKWEKSELNEKEKNEIANKWFQLKRNGSKEFELSFIENQVKNVLPDNFDKSKNNIAIFNSSEDEMKVITEWQTDLYSNQNESIFQLLEFYKGDNSIHFYLRIHPNLIDVDNDQTNEILKWKYDNLTIIPPGSKVDTYSLIDNCNKIINFGSTVGLETTYWGKPSILYGTSFYVNFDCTYNPKSFEELIELLKEENLEPKKKSNTFPYAFYYSNFGMESKSLEFKNDKVEKINNQKLRIFHFNSIKLFFKYLKDLNLWTKAHQAYYKKKLGLFDILKYK